MPITHSIDIGKRLVITRASGKISYAELGAAQSALFADPQFNAAFDHLLVFSNAVPSFTSDEAGVLAHADIFTGKRSVVVSRDSEYGLARMWQIHCELTRPEAPVRVFHTEEEALAWILADWKT
jgi:hypothetical protein